jgi:branched-subunit amino acid transport protein AzlD
MSLNTLVARTKGALTRKNAAAMVGSFKKQLPFMVMGTLAAIGLMEVAQAVGTLDAQSKGQALASAYNAVDDLTGGYGKALVMSITFVSTIFSVMASQATGPVLKFIGTAIFASMALGAGFVLAGAMVA